MNIRGNDSGGVFFYILGAILLLGVLIMTLTGGPQKSATTGQLDALANDLYGDVNGLASAVNDCVLNYSAAADLNGDGQICSENVLPGACNGLPVDNPNPPFPLYEINNVKNQASATGVTLNFQDGVAGANNLVCPGANGTPAIFTSRTIGGLRVLTDATTYDVHYRNDAAEGVLFRITPHAGGAMDGNPLWTEAISRVNDRFSTCKAANVTDAVTDGAACAKGCLYMWILRRATTVIGTPDNGVNCTAP